MNIIAHILLMPDHAMPNYVNVPKLHDLSVAPTQLVLVGNELINIEFIVFRFIRPNEKP